MALLDMLLKIREKYQLSIIVCHVNHNIRKESFKEAEFIKNYCGSIVGINEKEKNALW